MKNILALAALSVTLCLSTTSAFAQERGRVVVRQDGRYANRGYVREYRRPIIVGEYVPALPAFVTVFDLNTDCYISVPYFAGFYPGYRMYVGGRRFEGRRFEGGREYRGGRFGARR